MEQKGSAEGSSAILWDVAGCQADWTGLQAVIDGTESYSPADGERAAEWDCAAAPALFADRVLARRQSGKCAAQRVSRESCQNFECSPPNANASALRWRGLLLRSLPCGGSAGRNAAKNLGRSGANNSLAP